MSTIAIIIAAISAATSIIQIIQERRRRKELEAKISLLSDRQDSLSFAVAKTLPTENSRTVL